MTTILFVSPVSLPVSEVLTGKIGRRLAPCMQRGNGLALTAGGVTSGSVAMAAQWLSDSLWRERPPSFSACGTLPISEAEELGGIVWDHLALFVGAFLLGVTCAPLPRARRARGCLGSLNPPRQHPEGAHSAPLFYSRSQATVGVCKRVTRWKSPLADCDCASPSTAPTASLLRKMWSSPSVTTARLQLRRRLPWRWTARGTNPQPSQPQQRQRSRALGGSLWNGLLLVASFLLGLGGAARRHRRRLAQPWASPPVLHASLGSGGGRLGRTTGIHLPRLCIAGGGARVRRW